jgi:predicted RNase H-like HicB family nuclease
MTLKIVVHKAKEGGFWAEVPALPGCATEGDTMDELVANVREAVEGVLNVLADRADTNGGQILEIAV